MKQARSNPTRRSLREHLGITDTEVWSRLDLVGVSPADLDALGHAHPCVIDRLDEIVEEFYRRQTAVDEISVIIGDADSLARLQGAMRRYIVDIFTAEFNADYVNGRLRVGMVHKRIGVSPKLYLSSVRILKEVVSEHLRGIDGFDATDAIDAFDKVLHFDSALVFDAYLRSLMNEIDTAWARSEDNVRDVERRHTERARRLEEVARRDQLTGLSNRRGFMEALGTTLSQSLIGGQPATVIYVDVDDFKQVNDQQGHRAGDAALRTVATALRSACRDHDVIARLGGDEFGAILGDCDLEHAWAVAQRLTESLASIDVSITVSVGLAQSSPLTPTDGEELLARADARMYEAKKKPGNSIVA